MGLFDVFKKANDQEVSAQKQDQILETHKVNLSKSIVDLTKKTGLNLSNHKARVVVVMDYSGSMRDRFTDFSGVDTCDVQKSLLKLFPFALKFDDNQSLDVFLFSDDYLELDPMTNQNYASYTRNVVRKNTRRSGFMMGGTEYAPILEHLVKHVDDSIPTYVLFITDGDNADKNRTTEIIRKSSEENIFIQFIGIGGSRFDYLDKLDNLDERACDNTGFCKFTSIAIASDSQVYDLLIQEYANWLRVRGII